MAKNARGFDITINGELREVVMSYGLQDALTRLVGSPENVAAMLLNSDLRESILKEMLAERKANGKVLKPVDDIYDLNFDVDEVEEMLEWAAERIMGFFMKSLTKVARIGEKFDEEAKMLAPKTEEQSSSESGSANSTSAPQSSGPSKPRRLSGKS